MGGESFKFLWSLNYNKKTKSSQKTLFCKLSSFYFFCSFVRFSHNNFSIKTKCRKIMDCYKTASSPVVKIWCTVYIVHTHSKASTIFCYSISTENTKTINLSLKSKSRGGRGAKRQSYTLCLPSFFTRSFRFFKYSVTFTLINTEWLLFYVSRPEVYELFIFYHSVNTHCFFFIS